MEKNKVSFNKKWLKLLVFFFISIFFMTCLNLLLVHFENKSTEQTTIHNLADATWYMLVSLTSVGYGDMVPVSTYGKMIGFFYVLGSLGVLGVLISSISSNIIIMIEEKKMGHRGTNFEDHIILIGWNDFSRMVVDEVYGTMRKFAIVTNHKDDVDLIYSNYKKRRAFTLFADYQNLDAIKNANPDKASEVFINFGSDTEQLLYVINFKKKYPAPKIIVSCENSKLADTFYATGVSQVISRNEIASRFVASYIFEPDVADINMEVLSTAQNDHEYDNVEYKVIDQNPYKNKDYYVAFIDMKKKYNAVLLGISKGKAENRVLITNPTHEVKIEIGDHLIMMANGAAKKQIEEDFGIFEGRI